MTPLRRALQLLSPLRRGTLSAEREAERSPAAGSWLGIVLLYVAMAAFVAWDFTQAPNMPRQNEVAPFDIKSSDDFDLIDKVQTEFLKREAEKTIHPVFRFSPEIYGKIRQAAARVFEIAAAAKAPAAPAAIRALLKEKPIPFFDPEVSLDDLAGRLQDVAAEEPERIREAAAYIESLLEETISDKKEKMPGMDYPGVKPEDIPEIKDAANRKIRRSELPPDLKELVSRIFYHFARPTYVIDGDEMARKKTAIRNQIQPVKRHVAKGEIIVRTGEIVKPEHVEIFERLNLYEESRRPLGAFLGSALVAAAAITLLFLYVLHFRQGGTASRKTLLLTGSILFLVLALAKAGRLLLLSDAKITLLSNSMPFFSPFIVPAVAAPLLIALFLDAPLALFANATLAVLLQVTLRLKTFDYLIATLIAGAVAVLTIRKVNQRSDLTSAGAMISLANVATITGLTYMEGNAGSPNFTAWLARDVTWGFLNGFFSTVIALGFLPYLEWLFKISTPMRLLELSDLNQPLMKRLSSEAQGTFHHSILVGTLAESAAKEVGANALLCRVGSYYHDIGKLKRPQYFVENQAPGDNIHDTIKPNLSALAIMAHCRDGIEIAREHRLTREIMDMIEQHHGTNLMTYFYMKSAQGGPAEELGRQQIFRYPGPKPQSREAAIVLLADAVEAATRSIVRPTASSLKGTIKKIINGRFEDGQFDDCDLTLRDLSQIQYAFMRTILGMFHKRIEYPSERRKPARREAKPPRRDRPADDPVKTPAREAARTVPEGRPEESGDHADHGQQPPA